MGQVNINPPREGPPDRPRQWRTATAYILVGILLTLIVAALALLGLRSSGRELAVINPSATQTAAARVTATSTVAPTATPAGATPTPTAGGQPSATPTGGVPSNPTTVQATSGSCSDHTMTWTWSGAKNATGYDIILYNPVTGKVYAQNSTVDPHYTQVGAPGQTMALKVRARNGSTHASGYAAPSDTASIPPQTTNPTSVQVMTSTTSLVWNWSGAQAATGGYGVVLYHYEGSKAVVDKQTTVQGTSFHAAPHTGITYYLKIKALGRCAPDTYTQGYAAKSG